MTNIWNDLLEELLTKLNFLYKQGIAGYQSVVEPNWQPTNADVDPTIEVMAQH